MILTALLALQTSATPIDMLLDKVRTAVAIQAKPPMEIQLTGKATSRGVPCSYSLRFQPNGQYVQEMNGALLNGSGFDGLHHWETDPSGYHQTSLGEDPEWNDTVVDLMTNRWLRKGALREAHLLASSGDPIVLIREWGNSLPVRITVDKSTSIPKSAEFDTHVGTTSVTLERWSAIAGEQLPCSTRVDQSGDVTSMSIEQAKTNDELTGSYGIPKEQPQDFSYDASVSPEIEAKSIRGHLFVHPLLSGKDVGWFILDSCAEVMMIDTKTADSLNLEKVGGSAITGIGGTIVEPYRRARDITLGPAKVKNIIFSELDAAFLTKAFGIQVAGIVGADVFKRFVCEIDVQKPRVALYDKTKYQLSSGAWEPLLFFGGNPAVEGTMEGDRRGYFELDTGANSNLMVDAPFVKSMHLLDNRKQSETGIGGFGGGTDSTGGTISWLDLGGHRFENVDSVFALSDQGALANPYVIGVVGEPIMKPFNLVFDFDGYRVAFLPK